MLFFKPGKFCVKNAESETFIVAIHVKLFVCHCWGYTKSGTTKKTAFQVFFLPLTSHGQAQGYISFFSECGGVTLISMWLKEYFIYLFPPGMFPMLLWLHGSCWLFCRFVKTGTGTKLFYLDRLHTTST